MCCSLETAPLPQGGRSPPQHGGAGGPQHKQSFKGQQVARLNPPLFGPAGRAGRQAPGPRVVSKGGISLQPSLLEKSNLSWQKRRC